MNKRNDIMQSYTVEVGRGVAWWGEGFRLFRASPWHWIVITAFWLMLSLLLLLVPLGNLVVFVLTPVFTGGIMLGCHELAGNGTLREHHLIAGFKDGRAVPLLGLGAFSVVGVLAVLVVAGALTALLFPSVREFAEALSAGTAAPLPGFDLRTWAFTLLIALGLYLPVMMALWFAPVLVALDHAPPITSLGASLVACARNTLPFLVYGLVGLPLFLLALLPLGFGLLIFMPVMAASMYAGYRDVFAREPLVPITEPTGLVP